ncbi:MAG: hypothetical protein M3467_05675, partial [Actinomycetota bacterium]|nr:hypothetical protein [Actinomycetota bacterium]
LGTTGVAGAGWTDVVRTGTRRGEDRLDYIVTTLSTFYRLADLAVIEGPSYGSALQQGHDELAAIRWMVRHDLWRRGIPVAVCPPDNRTIYATGKARWKGEKSTQVKGRVRDAVAAQYGIDCTGTTRYDQADAYILMAMGCDWLGYPLADLPPTHRRSLVKVQWPTIVPAVAR